MMPSLSTKHPQCVGRPAREVWREAWDTVGPQLEAVLATGSNVYESERLIPLMMDGVLRDHYWTYSYSPVYGPERAVLGVLDVAQDVTSTVLGKQAAAEQRESEERLSAFTHATSDALFQVNADWSVMYQLSGNSFLADTESADPDWLTKYIHAEDQPAVLETAASANETRSIFELEHRVLRSDGTPGWTVSRAIPIVAEDGTVRHWFGAMTDISGRKDMEAALIQREKLAAVGRLASSIAHEINNPLEAVTNLLFLARQSAVSPEVAEWLDLADTELRRVSAITNQTLRFHRQSTSPQPVTCTSLFTATLNLYEGRLRNSGITVEKRKRAEEPVLCFEGDIRQVLSNLVTNAIDAMPRGGRIRRAAAGFAQAPPLPDSCRNRWTRTRQLRTQWATVRPPSAAP